MKMSNCSSRQEATDASEAAEATGSPSRRRKIRRASAAAAAAAMLAGGTLAVLAPFSSADTPTKDGSSGKAPRTVKVSGQLIPQDAAGTVYKVTGQLIGTWRFPDDPYNKTYYASDTRLIARGVENFEGCLNVNGNDKCEKSEPSGRFYGEYIYWTFLDRDGRLTEGGCTHALTGGNKAFTGVRGLFQMRDVYATTPAGSIASYQGEVVLGAIDEPPISPTATKVTARASSNRPAGC